MSARAVDGPGLLRATAFAVANLERHVEEVNALNVFPVPDGDTGNNMLATMRSALARAEALPPASRTLELVADAITDGALLGARGNSGVILSQIVRGMSASARGLRRASGAHLAEALRHGTRSAYAAVVEPVEGTILTVVREAAEAAQSAAEHEPAVESVLGVAVEAAAASVARTPSLLPVLREAGVVDSGGQGLFRLLEGALLVIGDREGVAAATAPWQRPAHAMPLAGACEEEGHGYETMFLLSAEAEDLDVEGIRARLAEVGASVLVAGDARRVRVHVHGPRPDLALSVGLAAGRLSEVTVEDLDRQAAAHQLRAAGDTAGPGEAGPAPASAVPGTSPGRPIAVVAVAPGEGISRVFESLGVARVILASAGHSPSIGELASAITTSGAREVLVLPNDPNVCLATEQAGALVPHARVAVIPTRNAVEGVAAILAFDARGSVHQNVETMTRASRSVQSLQVTVAVRDAVIGGRRVRRGQTLVLAPDQRLLAAGRDRLAVTLEGVRRLEHDFELLTLYYGEGADPAEAQRLGGLIMADRAGVAVEVVHGGQPHYPYLIAAE